MNTLICHDCKKELQKNQEYMPYETTNGLFAKCKECHQKDPVLRDYQTTEVYSRIVGYIRPLAQWNNGKQEEFKDRKEYISEKAACC